MVCLSLKKNHLELDTREEYQINAILIYLLKANNTVNPTGLPQGFSQIQILHM